MLKVIHNRANNLQNQINTVTMPSEILFRDSSYCISCGLHPNSSNLIKCYTYFSSSLLFYILSPIECKAL